MIEDPTFKDLFKSLLVKLNDSFPQEFTDKSLYKKVARIERKSASFIEKLENPDKFKFTEHLQKHLDCYEEAAADENTNDTQRHNEINDKILSIATNFIDMKKVNDEIMDKTVELKFSNDVQIKRPDKLPLSEIEDALQKFQDTV